MASQRARRRVARTMFPRNGSSHATHEKDDADRALVILVRILARQAACDAFARECRSPSPDISDEDARP